LDIFAKIIVEVSMNDSIKSFFISKGRVLAVDIFGYASKGIPGLEIIGLGNISKNIKEKLIFLTRSNQLKLPLKRFVIGIEPIGNFPKEKMREEIKFLELPILILFWRLAKILPISCLNKCMCSGYVGVPSELRPLELNSIISELMEKDETWIGVPMSSDNHKKINIINIRFLFERINKLNISQVKWKDF
jgi:hypothetical protein